MPRKNRKIIISRLNLIHEAASLVSEHGENPEYDRALAELIYYVSGGGSVEAVAKEIRTKTLAKS